MNLAARDIRHNLARFGLTACGVGLLLMIVIGMGGIYRGLISEATLLVDQMDADSGWCRATRAGLLPKSPAFRPTWKTGAGGSRRGASSRRFVSQTIQRELQGVPCAWPCKGSPGPRIRATGLRSGRAPLRQAHYEMMADRSLGLSLGEKIPLGKDIYEVVGLTRGMVGSGGDGMTFFTISDAQAIQFDLPGEATRLERAARQNRVIANDLGRVQPLLVERSVGLQQSARFRPPRSVHHGTAPAGR